MKITAPIKRFLVRSPLHRPCLEASVVFQLLNYKRHARKGQKDLPSPVYCLGNFKTGTVSLSGLLAQRLNGRHEPHVYLYSKVWLQRKRGKFSNNAWKQFLITRARTLNLEFEASGFLTIEAELLMQCFPQSKYILTIRDPLSWIRSMLRHIVKNRQKLHYDYCAPIWDYYFPRNHFQAEEASLRAKNLYPIQSMLDYWKSSNQGAIEAIPSSQLLILDTKELSTSVGLLESFMGWPQNSLDRSRSHLHRNKQQMDPLETISQDWLEAQCAPYQTLFNNWKLRSLPGSLSSGDDTPHV